jgi:hypothetical protein
VNVTATDWIQAVSAIVIAVASCGAAIATAYYAGLTKRLLEVQTEPAVTLDIETSNVAGPDQPLNFVQVTNHGSSPIIEIAMLAEPHELVPFPVHYWPEITGEGSEGWCIDDALRKALGELGIDSANLSENKPFLRLHLKYRRKIDGRSFREQLLCRVVLRAGLRPVAVYRGPEALLH